MTANVFSYYTLRLCAFAKKIFTQRFYVKIQTFFLFLQIFRATLSQLARARPGGSFFCFARKTISRKAAKARRKFKCLQKELFFFILFQISNPESFRLYKTAGSRLIRDKKNSLDF